MPITGIRIRGARQLNRKLTTIIQRVPIEQRRSVRKAANIVRDEMRRRVPVRTGRLRKSITTRVRTERSLLGGRFQLVAMRAVAEVGSLRRLRDAPGGKLKNVFWDRFMELGVRPHVQPRFLGGRTHPGHSARPFIEPAVRATADEVFREIGKTFRVIR